MTSPVLVCPYNDRLFQHLAGRTGVIRTEHIDEIGEIAQSASRHKVHLQCIAVHEDQSLADVRLRDEWRTVPVALFVPSAGAVRDLVRRIRVLRQFNIRIYLPPDRSENITAIRMLSSLGLESGVDLRSTPTSWDALSDLMTCSLLGLVPHAAVEPFHYVAVRYTPIARTDYGAVFFDDPAGYLHLNEAGCAALTAADLKEGRFLPWGLDGLDDLDLCPEYARALEEWRDAFLQPEGCAFCEGWRLCLGKFAEGGTGGNRCCGPFFAEFLNVVEQYQSLQKGKTSPWRP